MEQIVTLLEAAVDAPQSRFVSRLVGHHYDVTIARAERCYWSPCVQLELIQEGEEVDVQGLIGPHPNVWTLFAFLYITVATATGFGFVFGLVQLSLELPAWGLWTLPAGAVLCGLMYAMSQVGQRLAADQTRMLFDLIRSALGR